ncbi:MAG: hypothetical protein RMM10_13405, partial [Anaerolineae bacterium]|nr:hypothetical protein [Thermoflexus sp.]MDW8181941.1 hypothetical protein [Anaerolineae bacterium]
MKRVWCSDVKDCAAVQRAGEMWCIRPKGSIVAALLPVFVIAASLLFAGCGGGGGGGGGNRQILNGVNGIRQLANQNPRLASQVNNVGQLQDTLRDFT